MITENMVRSKKVSIREWLTNFLDEEKKVDADLLKEKSLQNKAQGLNMCVSSSRISVAPKISSYKSL